MFNAVIQSGIQNEIQIALEELRIAREQFEAADGRYVDAAAMKVSACETRLDCLYAEAKEGV